MSKGRERLIQLRLIHPFVQTPDKQIRPHFHLFPIITRFIDPDGLPVQLDLVHDFHGVVGILFAEELAEPEALVGHGDAVFGEEDVC